MPAAFFDGIALKTAGRNPALFVFFRLFLALQAEKTML